MRRKGQEKKKGACRAEGKGGWNEQGSGEGAGQERRSRGEEKE